MTTDANTIDSIDHIGIHVADIAQSVAWYTSSFTCEVISQSQTDAHLRFKNLDIWLHLPSKQPRHIGFKKTDANTYGELRKQPDGKETCFIADPTGNVIELIQC